MKIILYIPLFVQFTVDIMLRLHVFPSSKQGSI